MIEARAIRKLNGVKQSKITVTYRFSQPDQPMPLVMPHSYSADRVIRIPMAPKTVGDHIRKKRLALKLFQRDVAEQLAVDTTSIHNWETNMSKPSLQYMPAIIQFLGQSLTSRNRMGRAAGSGKDWHGASTEAGGEATRR